MFYEKVFKELNKRKVRYVVIGGIAVNLYGIPRFTRDLDLAVDLSEKNLTRLISTMNSLGYKPRSEEHTSELQSHSFISYAVFCLKKKKKKVTQLTYR